MTEKQAQQIVQEHARFYRDSPSQSRYALRWPPTAMRAIFGSSPRQLVEQLLTKYKK